METALDRVPHRPAVLQRAVPVLGVPAALLLGVWVAVGRGLAGAAGDLVLLYTLTLALPLTALLVVAGVLLPLVVGGRRRPRRVERAVVGQQARGIRELGDERRAGLVHVEHRRQPLEVADGQAAGPQHAGRTQSPLRGELIDEGEEVGDLLAGRSVHLGALARGAFEGGWVQRRRGVAAPLSQREGDLAR